MPATLDELLPQALSLTDDSKLRLAEELIASVGVSDNDNAVDTALVARRRAEFLAGTATLVPAEEALRQVRAELSEQRRAGAA
ncbi:MAG: addiction module protein [Verrucomicrobia bacterium]|nr:addiction module protein [Verrucomicrobiota bacterium]